MSSDLISQAVVSVTMVILWICAVIILRLTTPLLGFGLVFASIGLALCLGLLGASALELGNRRRSRRG